MPDEPVVPGVDVSTVPARVQAEFSANGPMERSVNDELARMEAEINAKLSPQQVPTAPVATIEPPQAQVQAPTAQPAPLPAGIPTPPTVEVPEKFKNADGTLNEDRLNKSLVNLEHYLQLEKDMHQKGQQAQAPLQAPQMQMPYPVQPQYAPAPEPFEARVNRDIQHDPGATVVNLMRAAVEQADQRAQAQVIDLRRRLELMEIGQKDPGVFTVEGAKALAGTIQENPWLLQSPTPWTLAYKIHGPITPQNGRGNTAPQAAQQAQVRPSAPILPGGQPQPSVSAPRLPNVNSEADLRRYLNERYPNNAQAQADALEQVMLRIQNQR